MSLYSQRIPLFAITIASIGLGLTPSRATGQLTTKKRDFEGTFGNGCKIEPFGNIESAVKYELGYNSVECGYTGDSVRYCFWPSGKLSFAQVNGILASVSQLEKLVPKKRRWKADYRQMPMYGPIGKFEKRTRYIPFASYSYPVVRAPQVSSFNHFRVFYRNSPLGGRQEIGKLLVGRTSHFDPGGGVGMRARTISIPRDYIGAKGAYRMVLVRGDGGAYASMDVHFDSDRVPFIRQLLLADSTAFWQWTIEHLDNLRSEIPRSLSDYERRRWAEDLSCGTGSYDEAFLLLMSETTRRTSLDEMIARYTVFAIDENVATPQIMKYCNSVDRSRLRALLKYKSFRLPNEIKSRRQEIAKLVRGEHK